MAAAAVSGVALCQTTLLSGCQRGPASKNAPKAFAVGVPALQSHGPTIRGAKSRQALRSNFWGCPTEACLKKASKSGVGRKQVGSGGALQVQAISQETASIWTAVYGVLLLGGGTSAYLKSGSKQSVISGAVGAALSGLAYYLQSQPDTHSTGLAVSFGYSLLFASVFAIRLFATKKPFPAAPLLALSLASAFVFASAYNA